MVLTSRVNAGITTSLSALEGADESDYRSSEAGDEPPSFEQASACFFTGHGLPHFIVLRACKPH